MVNIVESFGAQPAGIFDHLQEYTRPPYLFPGDVPSHLNVLRYQSSSTIFDIAKLQESVIQLHYSAAYDVILDEYIGDNPIREETLETTMGCLEVGRRISNEMRQWVYHHTGEFGHILLAASEMDALGDHNYEHGRRFEKNLPPIIATTSPKLFLYEGQDNIYIEEIAQAASSHDFDQLMTAHRNYYEGTSLDSKTGHKVVGGVYMFLLARTYAEIARVTLEKAEEITGGTGLLNVLHGEPDAWNGKEPAHGLHGEVLLKKFDDCELDPYTLSRSQILEIGVLQKTKGGFVTSDSPHGLHPAMEKAFGSGLISIETDDRPLFAHYTPKQRNALKLAAATINAADQLDMVLPFYEAQLRKFNVDRSIDRPTMKGDLKEFCAEINGGSQWFTSDASRTLFEYVKLFRTIRGTSLEHNPYVYQYFKDIAVMGVLQYQQFGELIMRGNIQEISQVIYTSYEERFQQGREKLLRKQNAPDTQKMINHLAHKLRYQRNLTMDNLTKKTRGMEPYSNEELTIFRAGCEYALDLIMQDYQISPEEMKLYEGRLLRGEKLLVPYKSYDSTGMLKSARVLNE
ncbi:MAG TPA: hypothetical protein VLG12_04655 [Candidatus Saccharimonadales bacterium]|nr:hypothetical protein [Candidatus Saccharimonadales bacterium]